MLLIKRLLLVLRIKGTTITNTDFHGYASKVKSVGSLDTSVVIFDDRVGVIVASPPRVVDGWGLLSASLRGG